MRLATGLGLGCGVRSVLVMVMDHVVVVVGVLCNKRCRGCGVDVTMLCWDLVGSWLVSSWLDRKNRLFRVWVWVNDCFFIVGEQGVSVVGKVVVGILC